MNETLEFLVRHGTAVLFAAVFVVPANLTKREKGQ